MAGVSAYWTLVWMSYVHRDYLQVGSLNEYFNMSMVVIILGSVWQCK